MNVIRVRENVRYERAKSETDHVAIGAPILDEERDLPAALEIERAPQQRHSRWTRCATASGRHGSVSLVSLDTRALQVPPRALYDGAALTFEVDPREEQMVAALREGDDRAFAWLVDQHHAMLVRLALRYVPDMATAEDVTQETWLHVLRGLGRFEFRSSLKTWIVSILKNRARTRATRERRNTPVSNAWLATVADEPAVDPDRFFGLENPALIDRWASAPRGVAPEEQLLAGETQAVIARAIEALPLAQREVITLRDIEGWSSADVCNALGLTETNQRVLLHRARSKVRAAVEPYLSPTEQP